MDERSERKLKFPVVAEYVCRFNDDDTVLMDAVSLAEWLGYTEQDGKGIRLLDVLSPANGSEVLRKMTRQQEVHGQTECLVPFLQKDGTEKWALNCGHTEILADGQSVIRNCLIPADDIGESIVSLHKEVEKYQDILSQKERVIDSLQLQASQDSLTQILNASSTRKLADMYLSVPDRSCVLIMIDIDDFKHFNDAYGHTTGDEVLVTISEKIKNLFRGSDIVGRVGGDEFVVIMKNVTDLAIVRARCAQIIEKFNETCVSEEESSGINCSVGVARYPQHGSNYAELFAVADRAMYQAKAAGKNQYYIEGDEMTHCCSPLGQKAML